MTNIRSVDFNRMGKKIPVLISYIVNKIRSYSRFMKKTAGLNNSMDLQLQLFIEIIRSKGVQRTYPKGLTFAYLLISFSKGRRMGDRFYDPYFNISIGACPSLLDRSCIFDVTTTDQCILTLPENVPVRVIPPSTKWMNLLVFFFFRVQPSGQMCGQLN